MMKWIRCDERLPEKEGVYLVTVLNREWKTDKSGIEEGLKPPHDEYWEQHKDLYGQLPDGRWVKVEQRVFRDGIWSGYMETVLAWMQMPRPYGVERQLSLMQEETVNPAYPLGGGGNYRCSNTVYANHIADDGKKVDVVAVVRCGECKHRAEITIRRDGKINIVSDGECPVEGRIRPDNWWYCKHGDRRDDAAD